MSLVIRSIRSKCKIWKIGSCSEVRSRRSKVSRCAGHLLDRFSSIAYFEPNRLRKKQLGNGKKPIDQRLSLGEDLFGEISKIIILPWHPRVFGFHRYQISTKNTPTFNQTDASPERGILCVRWNDDSQPDHHSSCTYRSMLSKTSHWLSIWKSDGRKMEANERWREKLPSFHQERTLHLSTLLLRPINSQTLRILPE